MAGKQERQRKLARERYERRLAREAQRQQSIRRTTQWTAGGVAVLVVVAVVVVGVIALTHSSKSNATGLSSPSSSPSLNTTPATTPTPTPTPTPTEVKEPATHCVYTPAPPAARNVGIPPATPDYKATYQATINTNRGPIVIDLLNSKATCTVNSFVFLSEKKFFNNTPCPRLVTTGIFVLQCGDPTGSGSGGPGYEFESENLTGATYPTGTLAMANSGTPNSNGSQFFIVFKNTPLPPSYTPFGQVTSGLNILLAVDKAGIKPPLNPAGGGHPKEAVTITSVTIKKT